MIQGCKHDVPVNVFALFFTDQRIIATKTADVLGNLATAGVVTGGAIGGLLGAAADQRRSGKKTMALAQLSPDEILAKDKRNFEIPYSTIQGVEMKAPGMLCTAEIKAKTTEKEASSAWRFPRSCSSNTSTL